MEWYQVLVIILSIFGMFLWNRKETKDEIREIRSEMKEFRMAIIDFHGRLCALEEKYKQFEAKKIIKKEKE
jgi:hypothetical protein